jgi:hypothetical protein
MNPRLLRPRASGLIATDADARAYISAVQIADGSSLEPAVQRAINDFVVGCKADGIWSAIKASCILMGARTLSGALTPLVGSAPTNNGPFVSGDYNRKTGLKGDGVGKYLNTNRANNADPQNSNHNAIYVDSQPGTGIHAYLAADGVGNVGNNTMFANSTNASGLSSMSRSAANTFNNLADQGFTSGFKGISRAVSSSYSVRSGGTTNTVSNTSNSPTSVNMCLFARTAANPAAFNPARLAFYSIGESLDLALLDTRVSALYTAIGAAIP